MTTDRRPPPAKPDTRTAMTLLIAQARDAIPFDLPVSRLCDGPCTGCPKKLLDYLDGELEIWERRLRDGEVPSFGDLRRLARAGHKIHAVLSKNGLIVP